MEGRNEKVHLHIAYATDNSYVMCTGVSMYSMLDNNKEFEDITVHVLLNNVDKDNQDKLQKITDLFLRKICFYDCQNIESYLGDECAEYFRKSSTNVPITSYCRLLLPELLDEKIDKVIYIDGDTLVLNSYKELWEENIDKYSVLGVIDNVGPKSKEKIGLKINDKYINAGSIVLNLDKFRKEGIVNKMLGFLKLNHGHVYHHDQGVINAVCRESIGIIEPKYNALTFIFENKKSERIKRIFNLDDYYTQSEIDEAIKKPICVHFTEGLSQRPWKKGSNHPLKNEWRKYYDKTVWKDIPLQKDTRTLRTKFVCLLNRILPTQVYLRLFGIFGRSEQN